jgi:hypothetical protein
MTLAGSTVLPGPASHTYYEVPPVLRTSAELNVPGKLRAELSLAYSRTYHLKPHAIVLSYLERRPLLDYIDRHAYAMSACFYQAPRSPASDILNTKADVVACRRLFARCQLPESMPKGNETQHNGKKFINEQHYKIFNMRFIVVEKL